MLEWLMRINCKFFGKSYTGSNPVYPISYTKTKLISIYYIKFNYD